MGPVTPELRSWLGGVVLNSSAKVKEDNAQQKRQHGPAFPLALQSRPVTLGVKCYRGENIE